MEPNGGERARVDGEQGGSQRSRRRASPGVKHKLASALGRLVPERVKDVALRGVLASMSDGQRSATLARYGVPQLRWSLENLHRCGFRPGGVIDVGAHVGGWTRELKRVFPDAHVHMVEARPSQAPLLERVCAAHPGSVDYAIALLGASRQDAVPFFVVSQRTGGAGSSVLSENSDAAREVVPLPMTTLDELVATQRWAPAALLKLDVQGYECEILRGAAETLRSVEVLLLEVSVWPYNEGAPTFDEVIGFLRSLGYTTYDVCTVMRRPQDRVLLQLDMLFVRAGSRLLADKITRRRRSGSESPPSASDPAATERAAAMVE